MNPPPKSRKNKPQDPFAQREADNYANPIPSREMILQLLESIGKPASQDELCMHLHLDSEEEAEALRRRLIAMRRDGQIISNRRGVFGLAANMELIRGRVQGNKEGSGYFIPEDGSDDLYLNRREMERLFDGDKVLARLEGVDRRGRKEGTVVEILQRRFTHIVGRYYRERGIGIVIPESKRIQHELLIPKDESGNAQDGQYVLAEILDYPSGRRKATARIDEVLGDVTTPGLEIDVAVRTHDIPHQFSKAVKKEADRLPKEVTDADRKGRFDLRDVPFVTIDGEDAKDFDDAVFAHRHQRGNYTLYVAIADVSHYVRPASPLDEEAEDRGTSVYFPGHVIPMLPEKLSNGLCSLKPKVDRLAMVCEMEIAADGEMTDFSFYEAVIHSHARLTYTEVADMVSTSGTGSAEKIQVRTRKKYQAITEHLDSLYSLYNVLRVNRNAEGSLDLDTVETRIVFGEDRKIREIIPVERNDAHRLIEECMLRANIAAATLLAESKLPALYRVHQGPNEDKVENFREYLAGQGLHLGGGAKPTPKDYRHLLDHIAGRADQNVLQIMLIRSMMQAVYQPDNIGHFGLNFELYTHFTSPIRRYPDLLVHRAIRYLIGQKNSRHAVASKDGKAIKKEKIYPYSAGDMQSLGVSCSAAERRADAASYDVIDWLKCEYMEQHVGDDFDGTIIAVTSFGLFVELENIYIEGLVHITELSNDYYHYDPVHHCLEAERGRHVYRLGERVRVKLIRVNMEEKKIDLRMLEEKGSGRKPRPKPNKKKKQVQGQKPKQKQKKSAKPKTKSRQSKQAKPARKRGRGRKS